MDSQVLEVDTPALRRGTRTSAGRGSTFFLDATQPLTQRGVSLDVDPLTYGAHVRGGPVPPGRVLLSLRVCGHTFARRRPRRGYASALRRRPPRGSTPRASSDKVGHLLLCSRLPSPPSPVATTATATTPHHTTVAAAGQERARAREPAAAMSAPKLGRNPSIRDRVEDTLHAHRNELVALLSK